MSMNHMASAVSVNESQRAPSTAQPYELTSTMELEALFLSNLKLVRRIVRHSASRYRLSEEEVCEIMSVVELKLILDNYGVFRRFRGGSKLATYLTTVVRNQCRDYMIRSWGKWRPSTAAQRLGPVAVALETLTKRDGFSTHEAVETLFYRYCGEKSRAELDELAARLPPHGPRRLGCRDAVVTSAPAVATDNLLRKELASKLRGCRRTLERALSELSVEERDILEMRFGKGFAVAKIAGILGLEPRPLYRRVQQLLARLRQDLERAGYRRDEVLAAVHAYVEDEGELDVQRDVDVSLVELSA